MDQTDITDKIHIHTLTLLCLQPWQPPLDFLCDRRRLYSRVCCSLTLPPRDMTWNMPDPAPEPEDGPTSGSSFRSGPLIALDYAEQATGVVF